MSPEWQSMISVPLPANCSQLVGCGDDFIILYISARFKNFQTISERVILLHTAIRFNPSAPEISLSLSLSIFAATQDPDSYIYRYFCFHYTYVQAVDPSFRSSVYNPYNPKSQNPSFLRAQKLRRGKNSKLIIFRSEAIVISLRPYLLINGSEWEPSASAVLFLLYNNQECIYNSLVCG